MRTAMTIAVAWFAGLSLAAMAADTQTTIFNTKNFHADKALWTNPAYYRNNTSGELVGMGLNIVPYEATGQVGAARLYGSLGTGKPGATDLKSPYPYKTGMEHYNAWLKAAKGGTHHTKTSLPDWSGEWAGGPAAERGPASDIVKYLKPKYQEYYVQEVKAAAEARNWTAQSMCLPRGFFYALTPNEFVNTPKMTWILAQSFTETPVRWIYVDQPHTDPNLQFPKWNGESIGFWDGDALIIHTNQFHGWRGGPGGEFTDSMETVEKYQRVGDEIRGEITMYDPDVYVGPAYEKLSFRLKKNVKPEERPLYNTCTDTNGPSPAVHLDANGFLNEHIPGEPGFDWNPGDPRPWTTWLNESDRRYANYLAKGGKPPKSADVTPPTKFSKGRE